MEQIRKLYNKYKEIFWYLFFGVTTTVVNIAVYTLMVMGFGINETVSNACAWFIAVIVAFFTNKIWVFHTEFKSLAKVVKEILFFFGSRAATGVLEVGGFPLLLYIGVDQTIFGVKGLAAKVLIGIIVIVLNYVLSKFFIFKKKKIESTTEGMEDNR